MYPTEALYHLLTLACVLMVVRRRHAGALLLAAVTAACSPFAGLELLASAGVWGVLEVGVLRNRDHRARFLMGVVGIAGAFLLYYIVYLAGFAEHRELASQMSLAWNMPLAGELLALVLVAPFAIVSLVRNPNTFANPRNRLMACWLVVALILSHHDLWMNPRQPIHFTRGYAWTALFLLGAPALISFLERPCGRGRKLVKVVFVAAFLSDNATWLARFVAEAREPGRNGVRVSADGEEVLRRLDRPESRGALILSEDERIGYLAIAETPARSWVGHHLETPGYADRKAEQEALFRDGVFLDAWENRPLFLVKYRKSRLPESVSRHGPAKILENRTFAVYRIDPDN